MGRVINSGLLAESTPIINHFSHLHQLQLFKFQPQQTLNVPSCSACNLKSSEIMYACLACNYYLHQTCSRLPDRINHQSHSHQLKLTFSPPYQNQVFSCDICKKTGSKQWLYRCDCCEFDAHLKCGSSFPVASQQQSVRTQNPAPAPSAAEMILNSYNNSYNASLAAIAAGINGQQSQVMNQVFHQTSNNDAYNRILQGLMPGGSAGGVGAGNPLQAIMGGGGAGNPLQTLMGGGGGGVDLQAFMGGGTGLDLQSLMGGGTGGAGTADLLQSLIGGGGAGAGAGLLQGFLGGF